MLIPGSGRRHNPRSTTPLLIAASSCTAPAGTRGERKALGGEAACGMLPVPSALALQGLFPPPEPFAASPGAAGGAGCFLAVLSSRRQQEGGLEKELGSFSPLLGVLILLSHRHLGMAVSPDVKGNGNGNGRGVLPSTLSQLHLSWHLKHLPLQTLLEAHADVCVLGNKRVNLAVLKVPLLVCSRFNTCLYPAPQLTAILGPRHLHDNFFFFFFCKARF